MSLIAEEPEGASPSSAGVLEHADALARAGSSLAAVARYRELLAAEPGNTVCRLRLARLLDHLGDGEEAVAILSQGLGREPDQADLLLARGATLTRLRRYEPAEADLRRVLRVDPSNAEAEVELGLLGWHRGLVSDAVQHFERALERRPDARVYGHLADALNQTGDLAGAQRALERALELDPRSARAHHLMGRVLDRMGRLEDAREMYQRARELGGP